MYGIIRYKVNKQYGAGSIQTAHTQRVLTLFSKTTQHEIDDDQRKKQQPYVEHLNCQTDARIYRLFRILYRNTQNSSIQQLANKRPAAATIGKHKHNATNRGVIRMSYVWDFSNERTLCWVSCWLLTNIQTYQVGFICATRTTQREPISMGFYVIFGRWHFLGPYCVCDDNNDITSMDRKSSCCEEFVIHASEDLWYFEVAGQQTFGWITIQTAHISRIW